ncbi:MAG: hypothetical protein M0009_04430 [Deltaproteobacteria bacterium]|nr:hypothetical protein [Deltaproteobacteria bacterium]
MKKQQMTIGAAALLFILLLVAGGAFAAAASSLPKYGPAGKPLATPLSKEHRFFQDPAQPAPDFWALIPFYVPQGNELSCSVASVVNVLNGLKSLKGALTYDIPNITGEAILAAVGAAHWRERVTPPGYGGEGGLTLAQLAEVVEAALASYGFSDYRVLVSEVKQNSPAELERLRRVLRENEKTAADFVIVHFLQDAITATPGGPFAHISPIGAYDAKTRRVLVLDVDRQWYEPYWTSDATLLSAMATPTKKFGYGGYLRIVRGGNGK